MRRKRRPQQSKATWRLLAVWRRSSSVKWKSRSINCARSCATPSKRSSAENQGRQERVRLFRGRPRQATRHLVRVRARLKGQRLQVERELQRIEGGAPALDEQASATNIEQKARPATERPGNLQREAADACQSQIVLLDERLEWLNRVSPRMAAALRRGGRKADPGPSAAMARRCVGVSQRLERRHSLAGE